MTLTCETTAVTLNATASTFGNFNWQTPSGEILDTQNPIVTEPGTYTLTVFFDNDCTASDVVEVISNTTLPDVNAGDDQTLDCNILVATLDGSLSQMGNQISYEWQNAIGEVLGTDLIVEVEESGVFQLMAINLENGCSNSDEVQVFDFQSITANDDNFDLASGEGLNENILQNDDTGNYQNILLTIQNPAQNGDMSLNNQGDLTYHPNSIFAGTEIITYQICAEDCPNICAEAVVSIQVSNDELFIPDGFTPNGDGVNDTWVIPGIELLPQGEVTIVNRWGDILLEAQPYLNDWDGTNSKGQPLPEGTYYYFVRSAVENGVLSGTVTILR